MPLLRLNSDPSKAAGSGTPRLAAGVRLTISLVAIAAIWLVILPAIAEVSSVSRMIRRHEAHGVDPSAKFYSELPAMPMITQRVSERRRLHPEAFGLPE